MTYSSGELYLVAYPFTDGVGTKPRPAVVVSSSRYNDSRADLVMMPLTSNLTPQFGIVVVQDWQSAGLLTASVIKPVFFSLEKARLLGRLGRLLPAEQTTLRSMLSQLLG